MASADTNFQCSQIRGLLQSDLKSGDCWCMIDWKWMKQWKIYVGYDLRSQQMRSLSMVLIRSHTQQQDWFEKGQPSAHPGPVDNADLLLNISNSYTLEDVRLLSAYLHFLSHKWKEFGLQLGLSIELLDAIPHAATPLLSKAAIVPSHEYHFRMMFIAWIRQQNGRCKPSLLARALSAVGADTQEKWSLLVQTIKDHLLEGKDFFFLPESAWNKLVEWYGITDDSRPIQRVVVEPGLYVKRNSIEVYPIKLKLCIHPHIEKLTTVPFSRGHTVEFLEGVIRKFYGVPENVESRVWYSCSLYRYKLLKDPQPCLQNAGLSDGQVIILEKRNRNGTWPREGGIEEESLATNSFDFVKLLEQVEVIEKQLVPLKSPTLPESECIPHLSEQIDASLPRVQEKGDDHQLVESLHQRITELERQLNEVQKSKQDSIQNYQQCLSEIEQKLDEQLITHQQQLQESQSATQEAIKQKNTLEEELRVVQEALSESTLQASTLQQQLQTSRQQLHDSQQAAAETAQAAIQRLQHQLQQSQQATQEVQQQLTQVTQDYQEVQRHADNLEQRLGSAERRLSASDETFREVIQRLLGQVPHSQPLWVI